jgi:thiol:disulfide interchange protein
LHLRLEALTTKKKIKMNETKVGQNRALLAIVYFIFLVSLLPAANAFTVSRSHTTRLLLWPPSPPQLRLSPGTLTSRYSPSSSSSSPPVTLRSVKTHGFLSSSSSRRQEITRTCSSLSRSATTNNTQEEATATTEEEESGQGFGVNERTLELSYLTRTDYENNTLHTSLTKTEEAETLFVPSSSSSSSNITNDTERSVSTTTTASALTPKSVLKFLGPTLALWIAPPIMSLIDTSVVGRFCGPTDLAALSRLHGY